MSEIQNTTYIVTHPYCKEHQTGTGHPEAPARIDAAIHALEKAGLMTEKNTVLTKKADETAVCLCHAKEYLEKAKRESLNAGNGATLSTGDTQIGTKSFEAALYAAGAAITGVDLVMKGTAANVFCLIRPPGHHAFEEKGSGFCLFNNAAIAARYAQKEYGINKVLIVDWDAHHGNGTQEIFYSDPSVFYFSTHNGHNYPYTGDGEETGEGLGRGSTLNCPVSPWQNPREKIKEAFNGALRKAMETYQPELVLISAGFDAHESDPLGGLNLKESDFSELTYIVKEIADRYAGGKIVSLLEGGYNLDALASSVKAHVAALSNNFQTISCKTVSNAAG